MASKDACAAHCRPKEGDYCGGPCLDGEGNAKVILCGGEPTAKDLEAVAEFQAYLRGEHDRVERRIAADDNADLWEREHGHGVYDGNFS